MKKIFCFPGQGSQYYTMGRQLFDSDPVFKSYMEKLDNYATTLLNFSLLDSIFSHSPKESFGFTNPLETHPAIFMVSYSLAMSIIDKGIQPDLLLGTSLGEFTAAAVGGAITPEETIRAAIIQARSLVENTEPGGMIAILESPELYEQHPEIHEASTLGGVNFNSHFIITGPQNNLANVMTFLDKQDITYYHLPVSLGFHSSLIDPGKKTFLENFFPLQKPFIPLISCCYKKILHELPDTFLWDVVREPINFKATVEAMEQEGPFIYIDSGPSGTMATFLNNLLPRDEKSKVYTTLSQFTGMEKRFKTLFEEVVIQN